MKLSISVLIGVIATIAGVSSLEFDLGYAGESLSDIPKEKRVDALFNHLDAWETVSYTHLTLPTIYSV